MIRNDRYQSVSFSAIFIVGLVTLFGENGEGFQPRIYSMKTPERQTFHTTQIRRSSRGILLRSSRNPVLFSLPSENESDSVRNLIENNSNDFDNEINEGDLEEIEPGQQRPDWRTMQQILGINIFTVILAALIVFFLSMNLVLGPGWLGSKIGIPGTGSIQEVSPSLPGSIDLNRPEYRL